MGNTKDGNDGNHKAKRPSLEGDDVSDEPIRGCLFKDANNADPTPRVEGDEPGGSRLLPLISRPENMCIRHKRMADEGATMRLQQVRTWREQRQTYCCQLLYSTLAACSACCNIKIRAV